MQQACRPGRRTCPGEPAVVVAAAQLAVAAAGATLGQAVAPERDCSNRRRQCLQRTVAVTTHCTTEILTGRTWAHTRRL